MADADDDACAVRQQDLSAHRFALPAHLHTVDEHRRARHGFDVHVPAAQVPPAFNTLCNNVHPHTFIGDVQLSETHAHHGASALTRCTHLL